PPYEGSWVFPGGMVESDETARQACVREVHEEVGMSVEATEFVGLYDDPGRDERGNVSAAYVCEPDEGEEPEPRDEALEVDVFEPEDVPEIGFDHGEILEDAVELR
ncbi:MAG: NUDIX domain-containing protein, partial [Halobacteria archaeon]|nr:NUDIX domain-containing protein [Halobacteria archaeon]